MFDKMTFGVLVSKFLTAPLTPESENTELYGRVFCKFLDVVKWLVAIIVWARRWLIILKASSTK